MGAGTEENTVVVPGDQAHQMDLNCFFDMDSRMFSRNSTVRADHSETSHGKNPIRNLWLKLG